MMGRSVASWFVMSKNKDCSTKKTKRRDPCATGYQRDVCCFRRSYGPFGVLLVSLCRIAVSSLRVQSSIWLLVWDQLRPSMCSIDSVRLGLLPRGGHHFLLGHRVVVVYQPT